ncbi:MAG TPA: hypothetical protein VEN81_11345 [Planctomycetota bacterium]|nr:hypothetical protein [Planctomycetota bacterium]
MILLVAILVLGPHRSGTSAVAGALHALGLYMDEPGNLMKAQGDNPKGFFEHYEFFDINNKILGRFGGSWQEPPALVPGWELDPKLQDLRERAVKLVDRLAKKPIWGWKDPRTCLTLDFWSTIVPPPVKAVVVVRNPLEVAQSLFKRDTIHLARGAKLWGIYLARAMERTRGIPRHIVLYEKLCAYTRRELSRMAQFAGLRTDEGIMKRAVDAVQGSLRHHRGTARDLRAAGDIPEIVQKAYLGIRLYAHLKKKGMAPDGMEDRVIGTLRSV